MADFEEVIKFMADSKSVTDTLRILETTVPRSMKVIRNRTDSILGDIGAKQFNDLLKQVKDFNKVIKKQTQLYKELAQAKKTASVLSGNIIPDFKKDKRTKQSLLDSPKIIRPGDRNIVPDFQSPRAPSTAGLSSPKIRDSLNKIVANDMRVQEKIENDSFQRRLRNRLNYDRKQKQIMEKAAQKATAAEARKQERVFKEQQKGIRRRLAALRKAAAKEIAQAKKTENSVANARRARASRGLRIGAGIAGATGSFRLASGLFTASTAVQGLPLEDFKTGNSLIKSIGKSAASAAPLVAGFTAAFIGIGAAVFEIKEGLKLEKEIAKLSTLFTDAALAGVPFQNALEETRHLALELASAFNIELTEAVEGFETALSAGINFPDLAEFSREAVELSQALKVSFSESVDILTTLKDSYKLDIGELTKVNNILFRTIDEGKVTVSDLSTNLGRVASVASTAGVDIADLFGLITFATRQGLKSSRAITSIAKFIESVVDPTDKAKAKFRELGLEFGQTAVKGEKLREFITQLSAKTGGQLDILSQLFPQDRALRIAASLSVSSEAAKDFISFVNEAGDSSRDAADAAARALDSTAVRFERFVKTIKGQTAIEGINLLEVLLPSAEDFDAALDQTRLNVSGFYRGLNTLISGGAALGSIAGDTVKRLYGFFTGDLSFSEGTDGTVVKQTYEDFKDGVESLNEAYERNALSVAKAAIAQGRFTDAVTVLVDSDLYPSLEEATKQAGYLRDSLNLDKNVSSIEGLAKVVESSLTNSLNEAINATADFAKKLSDLEDSAFQLRRKEGEGGLLPIEKKELNSIGLEIEKLVNKAEQKIATLGINVTQGVSDRVTMLQQTLTDAFEFAPGGVSTDGIETFVDGLRDIVGDTEQIQAIEKKLTELASERNKGSANTALKARADELAKLLGSLDFGSIATDLFSADNFDKEKILSLFTDEDRKKIAEASAAEIEAALQAIKDLREEENTLIDIGVKRGEDGVDTYNEQEKILKKLSSVQDKINESKKKELDFSKLTGAELTNRLNELDKLEKQGLEQANNNISNGQFEAAERNFEFLNKLQEVREALNKGLDDRAKKEAGYVEEIINLREKELEKAKEFEKKRTEDLKAEVEKRKSIVREAEQVQRSLNEDLFNRVLQGEDSARKQRSLVEDRFNKLLEDARKAAAGGDTQTARDLFGEARDAGSTLTDLDFNKRRRTGVDTARDVFDQLSDLNNTIKATDISASLDVTEQLNKGAAEFSTAVELLAKAMKEEGPLVSVDRSQNTYTITINNQRPNDEVVNNALEEFKRKLAQGTEENSRTPTKNIRSVAPPTRSSNPTGGAFPQ